MIPFVELKSQYRSIEQEIRQAVDEVLESTWYILGKQVRAFEEEFAAYVGVKHAVGVGSGTEALHLALRAVGVGPGDEVITVPNTCVPTVCAISCAGATPVLVDIDPDTLTMDPAKLVEAFTERTKAALPVHLYGHPCDMQPILDAAAERGVPVVEDCAQAHGSEYRRAKCGTFGAAAGFSFYPSKNIGAYGDAGAVVTDDDGLADALRKLRNYGEEKRYFHSMKGVNSRLDEMQAAILRVKLRHIDAWNEARRERAAAYAAQLDDAPVAVPFEAEWARSNYHLYAVRSPQRDELMEHLKCQEIGCLIHYPIPIHLQGAYQELGLGKGSFPEAEKACDEVLSLPIYPELALEDIETISDAVRDFVPSE